MTRFVITREPDVVARRGLYQYVQRAERRLFTPSRYDIWFSSYDKTSRVTVTQCTNDQKVQKLTKLKERQH
uniref:Transposase n=1 Tax=Bursaphelenchus xylophilus TaxID=6326 RepID=A0A1I7STP0_BURXY